jgi:hypothetical protein
VQISSTAARVCHRSGRIGVASYLQNESPSEANFDSWTVTNTNNAPIIRYEIAGTAGGQQHQQNSGDAPA